MLQTWIQLVRAYISIALLRVGQHAFKSVLMKDGDDDDVSAFKLELRLIYIRIMSEIGFRSIAWSLLSQGDSNAGPWERIGEPHPDDDPEDVRWVMKDEYKLVAKNNKSE